MENPKPCKCGCGGEAIYGKWVRKVGVIAHAVGCKNCGIQTKPYPTETEAIEAWNKAMGATDTNTGNKWIPVMEKLPTPWKDVLTTYEFEGRRYVQTAEYAGQNDENGHPLFCSYSDEYAPKHHEFIYIAWMPLPEPIKRIELG